MLKKNKKLFLKKDFDLIFNKGVKYYNAFIGLIVLKNNQKENKYSVIAGKKFSQKAVQRNRIKRIIYEILRDFDKKTKRGYNIVIIVFPKTKEIDFFQLKGKIFGVFKKAGIL